MFYAVTETGLVNSYVHIWCYEDVADRAKKRAAMQADPGWQEFMKKSAELGALVSAEQPDHERGAVLQAQALSPDGMWRAISAGMDFTEAELQRYARHIILPEIGGIGQAKLRQAKVLVVGAGGLGAPLLQYLGAAGIGTLGIIDHDTVGLSNLQRQVIHRTADLGVRKVDSARRALAEINPEVEVVAIAERLTADNAIAAGPALRHRRRRLGQFRHPLPADRCLLPRAQHPGGRGDPALRGAALDLEARISARRIPAIAACSPNRRRPTRCRAAPPPACWARWRARLAPAFQIRPAAWWKSARK